MRPILHVISGLRTGGAETMLVSLCRSLTARGLPQRVVALSDGPNAAILRGLGVPVRILDPRGSLKAGLAVLALSRLIGSLRPALVQGWLYHGDLLATIAHRLAGRPRATRLAWGLRNSDLDDARYGRLLAIGRHLSGWPDVVISNSRAGLDFHRARGYRPRRAAVIPNGIDTERFRPDPSARESVRTDLSLPLDTTVAIHAARVDPMKDHAGLIAAAAQVPEIAFLLVGAGTERLRLPANVRALGRRDDIARLYAAADIVVSSSAFGEGFSNALAEGMAAGLVPVATRVGDAGAILDGLGRMVEPSHPDVLAAALREVAGWEPRHRRDEGNAARARIESAFGPQVMADRFLEVWREAGADWTA